MPIEDLLARRNESLMRSEQSKLFSKMAEHAEMKPENIEKLRTMHSRYWHHSAAGLPDGWTEIVDEFLGRLDELGDLTDAVTVRFERCPDGLRAFAFPEMSRWHPEQMNGLRIAQRNLLHASREVCEWCGKDKAEPVELGQRATFFLCQEHGQSAREKLTAQVKAFEERVGFREQVSCLLPKHSLMSLHVSERNHPILQKALLDIKKIVEERGLVGKVFVTRVHESEGQLFISARCDQADPASQFEILDIVKHAEWQSDQASLAANKEGRDDDA